MALDTKISVALANIALDAEKAEFNSGILRIYSGTRPANVAAAITGTILAELTLNATAFGAAAAGVSTANAITADSSANATGTATHYRVFKSDGTTALEDGDVGTAAANLVLNTTSIVAGANVSISAYTRTRALNG